MYPGAEGVTEIPRNKIGKTGIEITIINCRIVGSFGFMFLEINN